MDGVLGSSWGIVHIGKKVHILRYATLRYAALRCAMQVGCGRLGMHRGIYIVYIVGVCVGVGTCGRRYSM